MRAVISRSGEVVDPFHAEFKHTIVTLAGGCVWCRYLKDGCCSPEGKRIMRAGNEQQNQDTNGKPNKKWFTPKSI